MQIVLEIYSKFVIIFPKALFSEWHWSIVQYVSSGEIWVIVPELLDSNFRPSTLFYVSIYSQNIRGLTAYFSAGFA